MTVEELPALVKGHILEKVTENFAYDNRHIYVTELLYCLRKAYYTRKLRKPLTLEHAWYIYRGNLFDDAWTSLFPQNQIRCTYRIPDVPVVIVGRADFIDDDGVIADLKTHANTRFLKEPKLEHVRQVLFYAWSNALQRARLYYVDFMNCKRFDIEVSEEEMRENVMGLVERARMLYHSLETDTPPSREEGWLCKYCEYKKECEGDE